MNYIYLTIQGNKNNFIVSGIHKYKIKLQEKSVQSFKISTFEGNPVLRVKLSATVDMFYIAFLLIYISCKLYTESKTL